MIRPTLLIKLLIFLSLFLTIDLMAYEESKYTIVHQNNIYQIRDFVSLKFPVSYLIFLNLIHESLWFYL